MSEQGKTYATFINEQLKAEQARRTSLDDRGGKLQQSASVAVGLFAAALGLMLGKDARIGGPALVLFVLAVVALSAAFLCGVLATRLISYAVADDSTMHKMLNAHWSDTEISSRNITAWLDAQTIERLRPGNDFKAAWLLVGIACQGVGVLLGAAAFAFAAAGSLRS